MNDITVGNAVDGKLGLADLRMDPAALAQQAAVAEEGGNPQLAENFRRAAELATIDDEEVMALYEALRPHRSTAAELEQLRTSLIDRGAPRCAALVRAGRRRLRPPRPAALTPCTVAGIDVGNHTTEILLARVDGGVVSAVAHGQAPTRGRKGSAESLQGAAALLHRIEVDADLRADELLLSALRPVDTATAPIPPAYSPSSPVRSLRRPDASTPAGAGHGVGCHVRLADLVASVVDGTRRRVGRRGRPTSRWRRGRSQRRSSADWQIVGVVAAQDDAVLIRNRIPIDVPVVDEADVDGLAPGALVAVEVVARGPARTARWPIPIALSAALRPPVDGLVEVAEFCRELADSAAIAVTRPHRAARPPAARRRLRRHPVDGRTVRYSPAQAHAVLRRSAPGIVDHVRLQAVPTAAQGLAVHDAFFTDLAVDRQRRVAAARRRRRPGHGRRAAGRRGGCRRGRHAERADRAAGLHAELRAGGRRVGRPHHAGLTARLDGVRHRRRHRRSDRTGAHRGRGGGGGVDHRRGRPRARASRERWPRRSNAHRRCGSRGRTSRTRRTGGVCS